MNSFKKISDININDPKSWENNFFLTFDIDWAHDKVINDTIDIVEKFDICATWFITHKTSTLERLRSNPKFQLGIHPNFNNLIKWNHLNGNSLENIIDRMIEIVPESQCVRSHSLFQSEKIFDLFLKKKLNYICNTFIPFNNSFSIQPWNLWNGIKIIPHAWQDNVSLKMKTGNFSDIPENSLKVFDFHPIHIFLNTDNIDKYESTRKYHQNPEILLNFRFQGDGIRNKLKSLINIKK